MICTTGIRCPVSLISVDIIVKPAAASNKISAPLVLLESFWGLHHLGQLVFPERRCTVRENEGVEYKRQPSDAGVFF